jgi:hypothetical protein
MDKKIVDKIEFLKKLGVNPEPEINKLLDKKIDDAVRKIKGGSSTAKPASKPKPVAKPQPRRVVRKPEERIIRTTTEETSTEVG